MRRSQPPCAIASRTEERRSHPTPPLPPLQFPPWATSNSVPRSEVLGTPPGGRGYVAIPPTCGPLLILSPALKRCRPPTRYMANLPTCGPLVILSPALKRWGPPRSYIANLPTCGPLVILSPALKRWGPPRQQGLCSPTAHLWASSAFVPHFEALGTPIR